MQKVGLIILEQLKYRPLDLMAWGSRGFQHFSDKHFTDTPHLGGLVFTVSGLKFKGQVMIRLAPNDTYIVEIGKLVKGEWEAKIQKDEVYVDELHSTIDDLVEGTMNLSKEEATEVYKKAKVPIF